MIQHISKANDLIDLQHIYMHTALEIELNVLVKTEMFKITFAQCCRPSKI